MNGGCFFFPPDCSHTAQSWNYLQGWNSVYGLLQSKSLLNMTLLRDVQSESRAWDATPVSDHGRVNRLPLQRPEQAEMPLAQRSSFLSLVHGSCIKLDHLSCIYSWMVPNDGLVLYGAFSLMGKDCQIVTSKN